MPDNLGYTPGEGASVAARLLGGVHHQRTMLIADTAAVSSVAAADSEVVLAAANAGRCGLQVFNDSPQSLYLQYGAGASVWGTFTAKVLPGATWHMQSPIYTGLISGMWESSTLGVSMLSSIHKTVSGMARITETTA